MATSLIDLRADESDDWQTVTLPGSNLPVRLRRLHADPETKASVSLVRFPAGWRRPVAGYYSAAEEFVVLDGAIEVIATHGPGEYVYLPPRTVRVNTNSPSGALVVAYFSQAPKWDEGTPANPPSAEPVYGRPTGVMRESTAEVRGGFRAVDYLPAEPLPTDSDILYLDEQEEPGSGCPPGPCRADVAPRWCAAGPSPPRLTGLVQPGARYTARSRRRCSRIACSAPATSPATMRSAMIRWSLSISCQRSSVRSSRKKRA